jgi:hypothetical protein
LYGGVSNIDSSKHSLLVNSREITEMETALQKPEMSEVTNFLRKHNALLVHFSGAPKGAGLERGNDHLFPADLTHVLQGKAMGGLSCSVVLPGDVFGGIERNATGCIGVVLGLQSPNSLVAVDPDDCGSMEDEATGIREVPHEGDITVADLERTLSERTAYNEWVVRNYVVLGILAVPPLEVSVLRSPEYPADMPEALRDTTPAPGIERVPPEQIVAMFEDNPMYTFKDGKILGRRDGRFYPVDHSEIYPVPIVIPECSRDSSAD